MNTHHLCFSGNLTCSGCNPCEACAQFIRQFVLPVAMVHGGFNNNPNQARAFFQGYQAGWQRFQQLMVSDPRFTQLLKVTDLSQLLQMFQPPPNQFAPPSNQPPQAQNQIPSPFQPPPQNFPPQPTSPSQENPFINPSFPFVNPYAPTPGQVPIMGQTPLGFSGFSPSPAESQPIVEQPITPINPPSQVEINHELNEKRNAEEKAKLQNMTTPKEEPLNIDDITSAASPAQLSNGPVVLGSVMPEGWKSKHERNGEGSE